MKKRYLLMAVAAVLLMAVMTGGSLAASQVGGTANETVAANLDTRALTIELDGEIKTDVATAGLMPGDTVDLGGLYKVSNTGAVADKDVSSYIRVTVRKVWVDENGVKQDLDSAMAILTANADGAWIQQADLFGREDAETQVFYYKVPVDPEQTTEALVSSLTLDPNMGNEYTNKHIVLEATADAVQYVAGHDDVNAAGILAAWGVKATLENGAITNIAQ